VWIIAIAPDGQHIELAYHSQVWVSRLRVQLSKDTEMLASDETSAKLNLVPGGNRKETVVKVEGKQSYEMVFSPVGQRISLSLRGFPERKWVAARVMADRNAGPEPIQARLDGVEDDVQQMASGRVASTLNSCVFDRFRDQALKVLARETRFTPTALGYSVVTSSRLSAAPICGSCQSSRECNPHFTAKGRQQGT
jgi:hypothetical protein